MDLTKDWWVVLDRSNQRIVYRSTSPLEAFRVARRCTGGAVSLGAAPDFGISVTGRRASVTVVRVAHLRAARGPVARHREARRHRVAIPVNAMDRGELVALPDGGEFTWVPAGPGEGPLLIGATREPRPDAG
jgi:hypothetical protein